MYDMIAVCYICHRHGPPAFSLNAWRRSLVTSIHKGREDKKDMDNYRRVTPSNDPGKIFVRLLLNRIREHVVLVQSRDRILGLRLLIESRVEYRLVLWVASIDFKKLLM